jgi:hypothetical protein
MKRVLRNVGVPLALYACWLGMMAVHEAGHVLHAWAGGGSVARVYLPPAGFSRTVLSANPRPLFVAWGGPAWGCVIPLILMLLTRLAARFMARPPKRARLAAMFFAGFCLVANGAYVGTGWTLRAGDGADMLRHGTPPWVMCGFGFVAVSAGLFLWHRIGVDMRGGPGGAQVP